MTWSGAGPGVAIAASALTVLATLLGGCGDDGGGEAATAGALTVTDGWMRPTAPFASVAAVYFVVENGGETADRLVAAASDRCPTIQLHRSELVGDTARMREVGPDDLEIGPGESLAFEPSGFHVMCLGFDGPFVAGETARLALSFAEAGEVEITVSVEDR